MVRVTTALDAGAVSIAWGVALGVGVLLIVSRTPRWGAASLHRRIAPYLRDLADPLGIEPVTVSGRAGSAGSHARLGVRLARSIGDEAEITGRLRRAAWVMDAGGFRQRQLLWALTGLFVGGLVAVLLTMTQRGGALVGAVPLLAAFAAAVAYDSTLTRAASARRARMQEELPTVLEFLALCLSAGEGMLDAVRRVSAVGSGELAVELRRVVLAVDTGEPLPDALATLSTRFDLPALTRAVDQLVAALGRGAPLAQVLHAHASDAREEAKRALIEGAGRKEITMLIPLVFAILPLSVLFAVFPGILMLRIGLG